MKNLTVLIIFLIAGIGFAQAGQAKGLFTAEDKPEMWCLAQNVYYEARGSNRADRIAVADVVLNRVQHTYYPNTICGVVHQGKQYASGQMIRNKCQFSWYCDGKADVPTNAEAWERSRKLARDIYLHKAYIGITEGATHYHANYVKPKWRLSLDRTTRVGSHIFYRQR